MTDREGLAFIIGLILGLLAATGGWWLQFAMIRAVA